MRGRILVIDDDEQVRGLTIAYLTYEGLVTEGLGAMTRAQVDAAMARFRPDVVLLDSSSQFEYGQSWGLAARLAAAPDGPALVMFTAHAADAREAIDRASDRSRRARFVAVVRKPFTLDELIDAVRVALGAPDSDARGD